MRNAKNLVLKVEDHPTDWDKCILIRKNSLDENWWLITIAARNNKVNWPELLIAVQSQWLISYILTLGSCSALPYRITVCFPLFFSYRVWKNEEKKQITVFPFNRGKEIIPSSPLVYDSFVVKLPCIYTSSDTS